MHLSVNRRTAPVAAALSLPLLSSPPPPKVPGRPAKQSWPRSWASTSSKSKWEKSFWFDVVSPSSPNATSAVMPCRLNAVAGTVETVKPVQQVPQAFILRSRPRRPRQGTWCRRGAPKTMFRTITPWTGAGCRRSDRSVRRSGCLAMLMSLQIQRDLSSDFHWRSVRRPISSTWRLSGCSVLAPLDDVRFRADVRHSVGTMHFQ